MKQFNVLVFNFNKKKVEPYDVFPYFVDEYKEYKRHKKNKPLADRKDVKEFLKNKSMYMFWSRCEWEVVVGSWPQGMGESKIDVHEQIMMNIDILCDLFMDQFKLN